LEEFFTASEISTLQDQLTRSQSNARRIEHLEQFLMQKLTGIPTDKLISAAIDRIYTTRGNIRIKSLIKELYVSQDAFEKRFRKTTGATPKQFSHIIKMNSVIAQFKSSPGLADLAFENGYYDQSHFTKDFKLFTGQTPTDFFQSPRLW
jgi:AraC-like DNA-binding protein